MEMILKSSAQPVGKDDDVVRGCGRDKSTADQYFLRDKNDRRAVYGGTEKFQNDPYWRDLILFHEYFPFRERRGARRESSDGVDRRDAYLMKMSALITPQAALSTESAYAAIQEEAHEATSVSGVGRGSDMRTVSPSSCPALIHSCRMRARRFPENS